MSWLHSNKYSAAIFLSEAEEFFYELSDIGHLELRLQLLIFERKFHDVIGERYHEVAVLLEALRAMERSRAMDGLLAVVLSFGNFMNIEVDHDGQLKGSKPSSKNSGRSKSKRSKLEPLGVSGFDLESLRRLKSVHSNDGRYSMLTFLVDFCKSNVHWKHCLKLPEELAFCGMAKSMKLCPQEMRRKVVCFYLFLSEMVGMLEMSETLEMLRFWQILWKMSRNDSDLLKKKVFH